MILPYSSFPCSWLRSWSVYNPGTEDDETQRPRAEINIKYNDQVFFPVMIEP
jgi:hypothetical protein